MLLMCVATVPVTYSAHKHIHRAVVAVKHRANVITHRQIFTEESPVKAVQIETVTAPALCAPGNDGFSYGGGFGGGYYGYGGGGFGGGSSGGGGFPYKPPYTSSVPETPTWIAMGIGAAAVGGAMRYRRKVEVKN
jgi:hypothetical protein